MTARTVAALDRAARAGAIGALILFAVLLLSLTGCDADAEGRRLGVGLVFFAVGYTLGAFGGHRRRRGERDE